MHWASYDVLIVKSPWDYFNRIDAFRSWLDQIERLSIRVLNAVSVLRWNVDKIYLQHMIDAGFPVIPTRWIDQGQAFEPDALFDTFHTDTLIVKPRVSAGAKQTFAIPRSQAHTYRATLEPLFLREAFMAQPFLAEIQTGGEWSLLFFNGRYSHGVCKRAKMGDFRVQHYLGGTVQPIDVPVAIQQQAQRIVDQFAQNCLYARVDGLVLQDTLWLMELELLEPFLFLTTHPNAFENYHQALRQLIRKENWA